MFAHSLAAARAAAGAAGRQRQTHRRPSALLGRGGASAAPRPLPQRSDLRGQGVGRSILPSIDRRGQKRGRRVVRYIGFDLPGSPNVKGTEKQIEELVRAAASLLVFQPLLKATPAKAFLTVLVRLQGGPPSKFLEAYGEFYQALSARGYSSWREYLLRQIFWGKFCSFAQQAAAGQLPDDPSSPMHQAAKRDLAVLQQLCISETTLLAWAEEVYPSIDRSWLEVASCIGSPSESPGEKSVSTNGNRQAAPTKLEGCGPPATAAQLRQAADVFFAQEKWSCGLPLLQQHYETYGAGLLGHHWRVGWQEDHLMELEPAELPSAAPWTFPDLRSGKEDVLPSIDDDQESLLVSNTLNHLQRRPAMHCLIRGPAGVGTSVVAWEPIVQAAREGMRVVQLSATGKQVTHKSLEQMCRSLSKHSRLRFVVVLENLQVRMGAEEHTSLVTYLSGMGGNLWPENVLLYTTTPITGPLLSGSSDGGVLEGCFGMTITVGKYSGHGTEI